MWLVAQTNISLVSDHSYLQIKSTMSSVSYPGSEVLTSVTSKREILTSNLYCWYPMDIKCTMDSIGMCMESIQSSDLSHTQKENTYIHI